MPDRHPVATTHETTAMRRHQILKIFRIAVAVASLVAVRGNAAWAADSVLAGGDFERDTVGEGPAGWKVFTPGTSPNILVVNGGAVDSKNCLRGEHSPSSSLVALSRPLVKPQQRVVIEFSFAFSESSRRVFHIWTSEPGATDAGRLNLCVQNGVLMQFDGRTRSCRRFHAT